MQSHESVTKCSGCTQNWLAHHVVRKEKGSKRTCAKRQCATVPIRHLCQVKALITSACLKHSDVTKNLTTGLKRAQLLFT